MSTFNLKTHMTKTANLDFEGARGYFLAQQRAWMNCSKCQREKGKGAQDAWQACFDEFQKGDRKMSWLENYAADEGMKISKESAVDYSEDVVKLAASGLAIGAAVTTALQQRIKTAQSRTPNTKEGWIQLIQHSNPSDVGAMAKQMPPEIKADPQVATAYQQKTGYPITSGGQTPGLVGNHSPAAPRHAVPGLTGGTNENTVLRRFSRESDQWVYYGGDKDGVSVEADLSSAVRLTREAATQSLKKFASQGKHYIPVPDSDGDWSKM